MCLGPDTCADNGIIDLGESMVAIFSIRISLSEFQNAPSLIANALLVFPLKLKEIETSVIFERSKFLRPSTMSSPMQHGGGRMKFPSAQDPSLSILRRVKGLMVKYKGRPSESLSKKCGPTEIIYSTLESDFGLFGGLAPWYHRSFPLTILWLPHLSYDPPSSVSDGLPTVFDQEPNCNGSQDSVQQNRPNGGEKPCF